MLKFNYTLVNSSNPLAMQLQSVGWVAGQEASNIKQGSLLMWNFGHVTEVLSIDKVTDKYLTITEKPVEGDNDKTYSRKLLKSRLVCIVS